MRIRPRNAMLSQSAGLQGHFGTSSSMIVLTSPRRCCILKLRLLIFSDGEPGKQNRQFVIVDKRSIKI